MDPTTATIISPEVVSTATIETTVAPPTITTEVKSEHTVRRGGRGIVGPHNIKGMFHAFQRREARKANGVSLKDFAHQTAENGSDEEKQIALTWLANKSGVSTKRDRAARQKNKGSQLIAIRLASKNAKRGK